MAGEAYAKRYAGGFIDLPNTSTPVDSTFLNAVETALLRLLGEDPLADEVGVWVPASNRFVFQKITNAHIDAAAAIDKSKLGALNIVNADIAAAAAIAKSKLAALNIVNADVAATAAIAKSKLAALNIVDADVDAAAAIALSKIAANASVVTSLPGSPTNGQIVTLTDSLTAPTYAWTLIYLSGISDANKWLFLGGSPISSEVATSESRNSTVYGDCATVHSLTLPRAGVYEFEYGFRGETNSAENNQQYMSPKYSAAEAVDADAAIAYYSSSSGDILNSLSRRKRFTVAAASQVVTMRYRQGTASTTSPVVDRWLKITPIRVA